jgi:hypothetical protein
MYRQFGCGAVGGDGADVDVKVVIMRSLIIVVVCMEGRELTCRTHKGGRDSVSSGQCALLLFIIDFGLLVDGRATVVIFPAIYLLVGGSLINSAV